MEFNAQMLQLFAKIRQKENDINEKNKQYLESVNLKGLLAAHKKVEEQFANAFSQMDLNFSEQIVSKMATV